MAVLLNLHLSNNNFWFLSFWVTRFFLEVKSLPPQNKSSDVNKNYINIGNGQKFELHINWFSIHFMVLVVLSSLAKGENTCNIRS